MVGPASPETAGWVWSGNVKALATLLSQLIEYRFDDSDWAAISTGMTGTDSDKPAGWFTYPLIGASRLDLLLANNVGSDVVSVRVLGTDLDPILVAQVSTVLMVLSEYEVNELD